MIYAQFAYLLHGVRAIYSKNFTLKNSFKQIWQNIKKIRLGSLLLLALYFLLVIPFADIVFRTPLLAKIQIPEFILDYMTRTPFLLTILIVFYVVVIFFEVRLLFTLPLMVFGQKKTRTAMKKSWQLTKKMQWWPIIWRLFLLAVFVAAVLTAFYLVVYGLQLLWDLLPGKYPALILAIANLSLIQIGSELVFIWSGVVALFIIFKPLKIVPIKEKAIKMHASKKLITFVSVVFGLVVITSIITNIMYLVGVNTHAPVIVSHRGVDNKNGVQNTLEALRKTVKENPNYVEIDLHETKDKQFIVIHDDNLQKLTGVNKNPHDLTPKKLNQKLLIEIKTTPNDSKKMLQTFNQKYTKTILKNKYEVQSLDYRVVEGLHQINPKLDVFYIQPYNFTYPRNVADGYSMEYSTLNSDFIWQAHLQHHPVYAWTINDEKLMKKMMYEQVDGLIIDRVKLAKKTIKEFQDDSSYVNRILNYITVVHMPNDLEA